MRGFIRLTCVLLSLMPDIVAAQSCPATAGVKPRFEFEVDHPAQVIPDSVIPYPDYSLNRRRPYPEDFALVQFVVDTSGRAEIQTVRLLTTPNDLSMDSVRAASARWRFRPATVGSCRVPQLVQVALHWK